MVEDKLLQLAVTRILEAIYEQDFLRCSYGYRPKKGALEAVDKLTIKLQFGRYNFVVEADIKGLKAWPSALARDEAVSSLRECGLPCGLRASLCTLQLTCSAFAS